MEVKGKLKEILTLQTGTGKTGNEWKKQTFVIETLDDQYPKLIAMDLFNDKCDLLNGIKEGTELTVGINIESREYNGKYFTNVNAWRIEAQSNNNSAASETTKDDFDPNDKDQLPF
jgi:hypothetical protein